ncbi:hypothetical protein BHE90_013095 [Fusarium euwallaceae]|uniref:Uncharacterized protein n=2 Tax=Fusarium solani species complex TaxID=232080 RepID=A0A430L9W1_9HYPO|nr:hypothetical protein CEP51_015586 [Fusarium floridanum]RTE72503.1 hypothetical protein BHE90_013095 [Fusarium euwallaceae]
MATQGFKELSNNQLAASSLTPMSPSDQPVAPETASERANGPRRLFRPRKREASHVTVDEPTQKRTRRNEGEPSVESSKPTLTTLSRRQRRKKAADLAEQQRQTAIDEQLKNEEESLRQMMKNVMDKVEKRHSESFKLRERRRHIREIMEDYESSVVINQRHIVGLNSGDREHFLRRLETVDRNLDKKNDEVERIQKALDLNREKVDGLLQEHADMLVKLARVGTILRGCFIPRRDL